jgi:ribA/ribD-fused uncharacterized protein
MKYNIENIPLDAKFLFFWGHTPSKDGSITKTCFSQWWQSAFLVEGVGYKTAEHWMMAKKALLFNDSEVFEKILLAKSAAEAKKLGREIKNYDEATWLANRYEIVKQGNIHKFSQNLDLREYLLQTNSRVLVEASPVDAIWGIGIASDNEEVNFPEKWKGLNLLGFALMEVRDELRK